MRPDKYVRNRGREEKKKKEKEGGERKPRSLPRLIRTLSMLSASLPS